MESGTLLRALVAVETILKSGILALLVLYSGFYGRVVFAQDPQKEAAGPTVCNSEVYLVPLKDLLVATYTAQPDLIMGRQDRVKAEANLLAAKTPFLPSASASFTTESFVSKVSGNGPGGVAVGSSIVGGASNYISYPSLGIDWNLYNGGRDIAQLHQAQAGISASGHDLGGAVNDTLGTVLQAYGDLTKAHRLLAQQQALHQLRAEMFARMQELAQQGRASLIKLGQARIALSQSERDEFQGCQNLTEKSGALSKAIGLRLQTNQILRVDDPLPQTQALPTDLHALGFLAEEDPKVKAAADKVVMAEKKLEQAKAGYYPSVTMSARYDLLGQNGAGPGGSLSAITSNSYWFGLTLQQSLGPFTTENATIDAAQADLIKARALYQQVLVDAQNRLKNALSENVRAENAARSALDSAQFAQQTLDLTRQLYQRGMTDLNTVDESQIGFLREQQAAFELSVDAAVSRWLMFRVLHPDNFASTLMTEGRAGFVLEAGPGS